MDAAQSILRKASPADLEKNLKQFQGLKALSDNNADAVEAALKKHYIPFGSMEKFPGDKKERPFLTCRYNKVAGSNKYRSPWTNQLWPKEKGDTSSADDVDEAFRLFELTTNEVWDAYKNLYYGHEAIGSVYLTKKSGSTGFSGLFGIYKNKPNTGSWHSASVIRVEEPGEETCMYHVETFVLTVMEPNEDGSELKVDLSATLSKETSKECKMNPTMILACHIENLGEIIEANEMDIRSQLERVQVPKALELVDALMKEKEKSDRPAVNPLMGMIMGSDVLKKKQMKG